eukprot:9105550-Heterocapsa_arctica.AAC.1
MTYYCPHCEQGPIDRDALAVHLTKRDHVRCLGYTRHRTHITQLALAGRLASWLASYDGYE